LSSRAYEIAIDEFDAYNAFLEKLTLENMGLRHPVQAYRCTDIAEFRRALRATTKKHGGTFSTKKPKNWEHSLRVGVGPNAIAIVYPRPIYGFNRDLSFALQVTPYLVARIQEGSHWDYSLWRGMQHLDQFSTFPQYWAEEDDEIENLYNQGRPEMVSLVFGVPIERFDRYLRHWYSDWDKRADDFKTHLEGKAYPKDRSPYCNYEQMWDFLDSFGNP
jgi:hypothetical protein